MILKLRFTTETSQEATFEDLVNFVFAPVTALTDAPWTGQVCSDQQSCSIAIHYHWAVSVAEAFIWSSSFFVLVFSTVFGYQ